MNAHGDVDGRVHIFVAMALRRGVVAKPYLGCLYSQESLVLIL